MTNPNPTNYKILDSHSQYRRCRIRVPDLRDPLSAICVDDKYYSLVKVVPEREKAFKILERLIDRGDEPVLIQIPKGYSIWVWEPEAYPEPPSKSSHRTPTSPPGLANYKILERNQYRACHVRVPDLKKRIAAINVNGNYYSFFKVFPDPDKAKEVVVQLSERGDLLAITQTPKGYAIWVFEPEAY